MGRMNGFRITVLTLLCLSVGLMFYAVLIVIPGWQGDYSAYQSSLKIAEYEEKNDIHRQQMMAYDPAVEAPEVEQARLDQEAAARRDEASINEAEESNVVAAAKRKEEVARARASRQKEEADNPRSAIIGRVASYDPEWNCVMMKPDVPELFQPGAVLAVRRDGLVVCEMVVDSRDAESGQVSATLKETDILSPEGETEKREPRPGDEVIVSPFMSAKELLQESSGAEVSPVQQQTDQTAVEAHTPPPLPPPPPAEEPEPLPQPPSESPAPQPSNSAPQPPAPSPLTPVHGSSELPSLDDTRNTLEQ